MKTFTDEHGESWVASAARERTDRHHGIWYLIFHREGNTSESLEVSEVRWQTRATAERTLRTMSDFELRRGLKSAVTRHAPGHGAVGAAAEGRVDRNRTNVNAG